MYPIYIQATPDQVWQALTRPALDEAATGRHQRAGEKIFISDWKKGSTYDMLHEEVGFVVSDPEQVVLESELNRRLSYTWHTITPEWAVEVGMDEATADIWRLNPVPGWPPSTLRMSGMRQSSSLSSTTGLNRARRSEGHL